MQPHKNGLGEAAASVDGPTGGAGAELEGLRATCRRQARVIDALSEAVLTVRSGAAALNADNAELRAASECVRDRGAARARADARIDAGVAVEVSLALDVRAPRGARIAVADCLRGRVSGSVLESARLVVSELVTNSVCHSGASGAAVAVVRVRRSRGAVWLEVQDPGRDGVIAPRPPDRDGGGGFGLNIVQALSERWGLERVAAGGTRVWAQLPRAPLSAPHTTHAPDATGGARRAANGKPHNGPAPGTRRPRPARGAADDRAARDRG